MLVAAPIGLCSAIFLAEYASPAHPELVKPILEILAGIPSVVLGFFALTVISPEIVQRINPQASGVQHPRGEHRRRHPVDPARRVGLRGRHAGRAAVAA